MLGEDWDGDVSGGSAIFLGFPLWGGWEHFDFLGSK